MPQSLFIRTLGIAFLVVVGWWFLREPEAQPIERASEEKKAAKTQPPIPTVDVVTPFSEIPVFTKTRNRKAFSLKMAQIKKGIPASQIRNLLGEPDDIRTNEDPGGIHTTKTKEIWCYGTKGHLTFPVLGRVYIDNKNQAQYIYGARGVPPDEKLLSEDKLDSLLRILDTCPAIGGVGLRPPPRNQNRELPQGTWKDQSDCSYRGISSGVFIVS